MALPVWLGGLAWLLFAPKGKPFRFLGVAYAIVLAVFIVLDGKSYYVLPAYTMLMAAGGVAIEDLVEAKPWRWLRTTLPALLATAGLVALPFGVPVLPVNAFLRYSRILPYANSVKTERDAVGVQLPQLYADMFGWENIADGVAQVYRDLPAADRAGCAILAGNYGEAGAIDYYGPALGLPRAISGHNSLFRLGSAGLYRLVRDHLRRALGRLHSILPRRPARRHHHQRAHDGDRVLDQGVRLPGADRAAFRSLAALQDDHLTMQRGSLSCLP